MGEFGWSYAASRGSIGQGPDVQTITGSSSLFDVNPHYDLDLWGDGSRESPIGGARKVGWWLGTGPISLRLPTGRVGSLTIHR